MSRSVSTASLNESCFQKARVWFVVFEVVDDLDIFCRALDMTLKKYDPSY